ncbi:MAG: aromatic ring-hydroxylating dioxygenase subunit alpha [Henriciella sp.]
MADQEHQTNTKSSSIASVKSYIKLPLVYNHWYVAGLDEEFGETPTAKTLLDKSIVFYRTSKGEVVAFQNRCLHRSFPLADGKVANDRLVCGYHGMEYDTDGKIARIPCQDHLPERKLKKYTLRKRGPYLFIWMGDEDAVDESKFPAFEFLDDPKFHFVHGVKRIEGSYLLLMENLNDLSHFSFLHANTFAIGEEYVRAEIEVGKNDKGVFCHRLFRDWEGLKPTYPSAVQEQVGDREVLNKNGGVSIAPGLWWGYSPLEVKGKPGEDDFEVKTYVMHFVTPETATTAHYWWALYKDFPFENDVAKDMTQQLFSTAFDEDTAAVQNMQELLEADVSEYEEMIIAGDQAGLLFRREMLKWVQEEYPDFV